MSIAPNTLSVNRGLDRNDIILVYNLMRIKQEGSTMEHNIGWTLSDLFTELVREHEAMHQ